MEHRIDIFRTRLHPLLDYKLGLLLKKLAKENMYIIVTSGYRSAEEQDKLYAQGRTTPGSIITNAKGGYSQHNWGIAIDIAMRWDVDKDGKTTDDTWNEVGFKKVAKIAKSVGLCWGGDWKSFKDTPHLYLDGYGSGTDVLRSKYGTFANYKKTWTAKATYKTGTRIWSNRLFKNQKGLIPKGATCDVLVRKSVYTKVKYGNTIGFVRTKWLAK